MKTPQIIARRLHRSAQVTVSMAMLYLTSVTAVHAMTDGHSVEAIANALAEPIPAEVVTKAREVDDQILAQGSVDGDRIYLVTDKRLTRLRTLADKLLIVMGEDPALWVVRLLDSEPKIENAFVAGGKYVYVYTGLLANARSDDELAFVLGHEIGHSLLKHNIRRESDMLSQLANIAALYGAISKGGTANNAAAIGKALSASYSQDDEREADTFGVAISWRAGFDPMRGVDFFTREAKDQNKGKAERDAQLDEYRKEVVRLQEECTEVRQQWANWTLFHSQENAKKLDDACGMASQHANAFNSALGQAKLEDSLGNPEQLLSSHPMAQDRIAAVAALTDYYKGARSLESLTNYEQPFRVMTALVQSQSILVQPRTEVEMETAKTATMPQAPPTSTTKSSIADRLRQLEELHKNGLVSDAEYEGKRKSLLSEL